MLDDYNTNIFDDDEGGEPVGMTSVGAGLDRGRDDDELDL